MKDFFLALVRNWKAFLARWTLYFAIILFSYEFLVRRLDLSVLLFLLILTLLISAMHVLAKDDYESQMQDKNTENKRKIYAVLDFLYRKRLIIKSIQSIFVSHFERFGDSPSTRIRAIFDLFYRVIPEKQYSSIREIRHTGLSRSPVPKSTDIDIPSWHSVKQFLGLEVGEFHGDFDDFLIPKWITYEFEEPIWFAVGSTFEAEHVAVLKRGIETTDTYRQILKDMSEIRNDVLSIMQLISRNFQSREKQFSEEELLHLLIKSFFWFGIIKYGEEKSSGHKDPLAVTFTTWP